MFGCSVSIKSTIGVLQRTISPLICISITAADDLSDQRPFHPLDGIFPRATVVLQNIIIISFMYYFSEFYFFLCSMLRC